MKKSDPAFKKPVLTELEKFVYENSDRHTALLASQLNRTEAAICAAYTRADKKVEDLKAIQLRGQ